VTDPAGREGSATVLHEWMQRGAGELDSRSFSDALDALGLRRGGSAGSEYSAWGGSLLADALPEALALFALMVREPQLTTQEFESARGVAREELASLGDNPAQRMFLMLGEEYFASGHGRSPYGSEEGLAALSEASLKEDFARRVGPEGAILSVAGGADWEALQGEVEAAFGSWRGHSEPLPDVRVRPAHARHETADTAQLQIGAAFGAAAPGAPGWYENALTVSVLSGGMASRLFTEVREKRGLVYAVAAVSRAVRGFGYTLAYAGTTPERADETLSVMLAELARVREGVTGAELERARTGILSSLVMQSESSGARSSSLARDSYLLGAPRSLAEVRASIEAVGLDDLNRYLAARPLPEFTLMTLGPERLPPPREVATPTPTQTRVKA
jgi:predicted Zn-dependent peptidase